MTESDDVKPLGIGALTLMLQLAVRDPANAATPDEKTLWVARNLKAPPSISLLLTSKLQELGEDATASDFTVGELRLIRAARRYGDQTDAITDIRQEFSTKAQKWAFANIDRFQDKITQAINDHLSEQTSALLSITDEEIRRIRTIVSSRTPSLARSFALRIAEGAVIESSYTVDAALEALLDEAVPVSELEMLRTPISIQSRQQLTFSVSDVAEALRFGRSELRPIVASLLEVKALEAELPALKQEAATALEALEATTANARWGAAAPDPESV